MINKRFQVLLTSAILFALVLSLMPGQSTYAQEPQPPKPPVTSPTPPVPPNPGGSGNDDDEKTQMNTRNLLSGSTEDDKTTLSVPIGAPGLSFRYVNTIGVTGEPYLVDDSHINHPNGLFIDSSDNLYVAEEMGSRLMKFDLANPTNATLIIGHAGIRFHHDDYLAVPSDVTVRSSDGHIWVAADPFIKEFDETGVLVQSIPEINPWESGSDDYHFIDPRGIAFGPGGYLYVSDSGNHRIQIYDVSGGSAVYVATIGTTEISQTDNTGFNNPKQITFDSLGRIYAIDFVNLRVQRCSSSSPWTTWTCETFFGETGVEGDDLSHLRWAWGVGADSSDNIYIADGINYRILKCNTSGVCSVFAGETGVSGSDNAHFGFTDDIAFDSAGNVYISDFTNTRVQKFDSAGTYQSTIGVTNVPYLTDTTRMFYPWGITVAPDGSIYTTEQFGNRLIKMNAAGTQQWTVGEAGIDGSDNAHFSRPEGNPAVDASGRVYVADTGNNRVQIYNTDGSYFGTLGNGWGQGDYEFACPEAVAINPTNGDIHVLELCNQRVQVYTSDLVYKATVGITNSWGSDNWHFNNPRGLAVDGNGNIFVGDSDNHRVQKCALTEDTYACTTFTGLDGSFGNSFSQLHPLSVALDASGRVYVADEWNNRVQVYSPSGEYLTTIGGNWGSENGDMMSPKGVAIDTVGNVYVAEGDNHRIQKFAPGTPNWAQTNVNGFGDISNSGIFALSEFNGKLFAGTNNGNSAQIWGSADGKTWIPMMTGGFGDYTNQGIDHLLPFNGQLYASTYNWDSGTETTNGGQLWRSTTGKTWEWATPDGLDGSTNAELFRMTVYDNNLYVSTWSDPADHGTEIWRSATGNSDDWIQIESNGFGDSENSAALAFESYGGYLYAGTLNSSTGGEIWRSTTGNGGDWLQVNDDGFGNADNIGISALANFGGHLYAVTRNNSGAGAQVWRCQVCDNTDWTQVADNGFGNPDNYRNSALEVLNNYLYLVIGNDVTGLGVWRTIDGTTWDQIASGGFGAKNNFTTYWDNAVTIFDQQLFVGTINWANGAQIWRAKLKTSLSVGSDSTQDGWVLESGENTNVGGTMNNSATTLRLGDDATKKQYRSILSFVTSILPDTAKLTKVTLKVKRQSIKGGGDPIAMFQGVMVDLRKGLFGTANLQATDFQTVATKTGGPFTPALSGGWYSIDLTSATFASINKLASNGGLTQIRLRFKLDDNNNGTANILNLYSGNASAIDQPQLIIEYYVP